MSNNTVIIGWADTDGQGASKVLAGLDISPNEQAEIMDKASRLHKFPDGVKHLAQCRVEVVQRAIFISSNIGERIEADQKAAQAEQKKRDEAAAEVKKSAAALKSSQEKVNRLAASRNKLQGELHKAQTTARNLEATPEGLRDGKTHQNALTQVKAAIFGDPDKKVSGLEQQVKDAIAAYDIAAAELAELKTPEQRKQTQNIITGVNQ